MPVLANDMDPDGDALSLLSVTDPTGGATSIAGDQIRVVPNADFSGTLTFDYRVTDGSAVARGTVTVQVSPVEDAPIARADSGSTKIGGSTITIAVLANDSDPDGDTIQIVAVGAPTHGSAIWNKGETSVTYRPPCCAPAGAPAPSSDSFSYQITDSTGRTATATVTISFG